MRAVRENRENQQNRIKVLLSRAAHHFQGAADKHAHFECICNYLQIPSLAMLQITPHVG